MFSTKILNYIAFCAVVPEVCYAEEIRDQFPGDVWIYLCNSNSEDWRFVRNNRRISLIGVMFILYDRRISN